MTSGIYNSSEVSEDELRAMLTSYAGPERARIRPRRRQIRGWVLIAGLAAVSAAGALAALEWVDTGSGRLSSLTIPATPRNSLVEIQVDQMIERADVVFIGHVTTIEGPDLLSDRGPLDEATPISAYRVSYAVDHALRSKDVETVTVTDIVARGLPAFAADTGAQYLIFAEWSQIGPEQIVELIPVGYDQGVFRVTNPETAVNTRGVSVDLNEISKRVSGE